MSHSVALRHAGLASAASRGLLGRFAAPARLYSSTLAYDTPPFEKILVANRGEIAVRVMRTAKRMGMKTVAVYSTADENAMHVKMADEAYCVGPPPTSESYLRVDNVLRAVRETGAQAVHPGYGFLSEKADFAKALEELGVAFVGPNSYSISHLGDKLESKKLAAAAGVHTIPGFKGEVHDLDHARQIAHEIKYPVMVKASSGGGGKGMRIAWNDEELIDAYRLSKAEAKSSFGDDRLLVEKFIDNPRHIEIQVLGDKHGNTVYLNERECSIQRRNQKVVEEAPSVHLDEKTRAAMGAQAVALAKAVKYDSAGTCEFLVDPERNFYFLEMNTRLQVEHPITEYITGVDIVEHMFNVAAGRHLPLQQKDIGINGWAFETRVYAEDPVKYLPSIGRLSTYIEPRGGADVRIDSGIVEGSEISVYYDPMISKLVTHGATREEARLRMVRALDEYVIKGVTHNIPLLRDVLTAPRFAAGKLSTKYLPEEYPDGFKGVQLNDEEKETLIATAAYVYARRYEQNVEWRAASVIESFMPQDEIKAEMTIQNVGTFTVGIERSFDGVAVTVDGKTVNVAADWPVNSPLIESHVDGRESILQFLDPLPLGFRLVHCGTRFDIKVLDERAAALAKHMKEKPKEDLSNVIIAPMPGTVVSVAVKKGDRVVEGQEIAVVEAMKMQNVLRAQKLGVVKSVNLKAGESVAADQVLIEFEKEAAPAAKK